MKKKAFSLLLVLVLALSLLPAGVLAAEGGGESGDDPVTPAAEKYTIKFAAGDGTGSMTDVNVDKVENAAAEYELPACGFTAPKGKEFDAWTASVGTIAEGKLTIPADTDTTTAIILTATWKDLPTYTIVFNPNGADGEAKTQKIKATDVDGENYIVFVPPISDVFTTPPSGQEADAWVVNDNAPTDVTISVLRLTIPKSVTTAIEIPLKATWKEASPTVNLTFLFDENDVDVRDIPYKITDEGGECTGTRNQTLGFHVFGLNGKVVHSVIANGESLTSNDGNTFSYFVTGDTTFIIVASDPALEFTASQVTLNQEGTAELTLASAPAANTTYKVYDVATGGSALTSVTVTVKGDAPVTARAASTTLVLTLNETERASLTSAGKTYYISATEGEKAESARTGVKVLPYQISSGGNTGNTGNTGGSSSGGSSSGGSTSRPSTSTTNPDGSKTTTTTKSDGTKVETTTHPGGNKTVVETKKDGTVTTTETTRDGGRTVTTERPDGSSKTEVTQADGSKSTTTVSASGAATVTATVGKPVENTPVTLAAPPIDVRTEAAQVTVSTGVRYTVRVEVPVVRVAPSTVAMAVNPDGTTTIIKNAIPGEDGLVVPMTDGQTIKITENAKSFTDTAAAPWAQDAISFVTAREMFSGTSDDAFSPNRPMSRAMLMTVLARLDGADTSDTPYEKGMAWAVEKGISDGSNLSGNISREQLAVMLWRYAGSPASTASLEFTDTESVSGYAQEALGWAVENGVMGGYTDGSIGPQRQATRAQVAAMLQRYIMASYR